MIRHPWWFCNGWLSPWCLFDVMLHWLTGTGSDHLPGPLSWICRKHHQALERAALTTEAKQ